MTLLLNSKKAVSQAEQFVFFKESMVTFAMPDPEEKDDKKKTKNFSLVPYKGQIFGHPFWGKLAFDMSGLSMAKDVIPCLMDHDRSKIVGAIDSFSTDGGQVTMNGEFEDTAAARELLSLNKVKPECSLAFDLYNSTVQEVFDGQLETVNGKEFQGPGFIVREAKIYETSMTLFGAVPDTETSFNKTGDTKEISIFKREGKTMDQVSIDKSISDASLKAKADALELFNKFKGLCDDVSFVAEHFSKGSTLEQFKDALFAKVVAENASLKAQEGRTAHIAFASTEGQKTGNFMDVAKEYAKTEKVSITEAMKFIAKTQPKLHDSFIQNCPITTKGGRK